MYETRTKNKVFANVNDVLFSVAQLEDIEVVTYLDGEEEACLLITYISGRKKPLFKGTKKQCDRMKHKVMSLL